MGSNPIGGATKIPRMEAFSGFFLLIYSLISPEIRRYGVHGRVHRLRRGLCVTDGGRNVRGAIFMDGSGFFAFLLILFRCRSRFLIPQCADRRTLEKCRHPYCKIVGCIPECIGKIWLFQKGESIGERKPLFQCVKRLVYIRYKPLENLPQEEKRYAVGSIRPVYQSEAASG